MEKLNGCLPLPLQHLSLMVLVSELESYPVELLASLPHWLRYRLINNLPALDLCRLDFTAVVKDIDINKIWKDKYIQSNSCYSSLPINKQSVHDTSTVSSLELRLAAVLDNAGNWRERHLLNIVHSILCFGDLSHAAIWLIAISGCHLLQNLSVLDDEQPDEKLVQSVFIKQGHPLLHFRGDSFQLIPHRLQHIYSDASPTHLLSLLTLSCGLQPSYFHLDSMLCGACHSLWDEHEGVAPSLKHLLRRVVMLRLSNVQKNILRRTFKAVVGEGNDCQLLSLSLSDFCVHKEEFECLSPYLLTLPNDCSPPLYQGLSVLQLSHALHPSSLPYLTALLNQQLSLKVVVIHGFFPWPTEREMADFLPTLSSLYSRSTFQSLFLKWPNISISQTTQIVMDFMTAHCTDTQELMIVQQCCYTTTDPTALASLDVGGCNVPDCGVQHKVIQFTESLMPILLKLNTIRLRELDLDCERNHIHLATTHPDLRVAKLKLAFYKLQPGLSTLSQDIRALFGMPTLQEVTLEGPWTELKEARKGLVLGLQQQVKMGSLKKISLLTQSSSAYTQQELVDLWNGLFSLKHLDQLEVVIGEGLSRQVKQQMAQIMNACWQHFASGKKLKKISLCVCVEEQDLHVEDYKKIIANMAQDISIQNTSNCSPYK